MTEPTRGQKLLEDAYKLETPEDNRSYYDEFAATYDSDFAETLGYDYPRAIARVYHARATSDDRPVADIGCGTGLVAAALELPAEAIDGLDISAGMLREAGAKGLYRALFLADLTGPAEALPGGYGAVVSAGTFTHGHLGPEPLVSLLAMARPGALFVIGVNAQHYRDTGFAAVIEGLEAADRIRAVETETAEMYGKAGHDHSGDRAMVLSWRTGEASA